VKERQVAIGRWLTAVITGNLLGSSLAGVVGDLVGWRGVFFVITALGVRARRRARHAAQGGARQACPVEPVRASAAATARSSPIPRAKVCFSAVFVEGIVIFGLFPFVALLLLAAGEPRASVAGAVIAGFSLGGVIYALAVPRLVARWRPDQLMTGGGIIAAFRARDRVVRPDLAGAVRRPSRCSASASTRCTPRSRCRRPSSRRSRAAPRCRCTRSASSWAMRAAPVLYGLGFMTLGSAVTLTISAVIIMAVGFVCSRLLRERPAAP
jgi:hypothetical protein